VSKSSPTDYTSFFRFVLTSESAESSPKELQEILEMAPVEVLSKASTQAGA
jgi:hypothetical protein